MDINAINNQSVNLNVNNQSSLQLNKVQQTGKISEVSEELNLDISPLSSQVSEFSSNIQALNDGIAISKISQVALDKQQDYLKNIEDKLANIENYQDKNDLKKEINDELRAFNQVAYSTSYKQESLLVQNFYDESDSIDINTSEQTYSLSKPNVANVANNLFETINNFDLNDATNVQEAISLIDASQTALSELADSFESFSKELEEKAIEKMQEQNNSLFKNSIDFGKEVEDFSKTNINANAGYLAASQANIIQEQSVRLLS